MKKSIYLFITLLSCLCRISSIYAQDTIVINNLKYEIFPKYNHATLIPREGGYSGNINIPSTLTIDYEPYKVTTIASGTFANCNELKEVIIPETVSLIKKDAFIEVPAGLNIYINNTHPPRSNGAFDLSCFENAKVFFSTEDIQYRNTKYAPWSKFKNTGIVPKNKSDGIDRRTDSEKRKTKVTRL